MIDTSVSKGSKYYNGVLWEFKRAQLLQESNMGVPVSNQRGQVLPSTGSGIAINGVRYCHQRGQVLPSTGSWFCGRELVHGTPPLAIDGIRIGTGFKIKNLSCRICV